MKFQSTDPVGGSYNLDMNIFAAVAPDVVIERRLWEDDAVIGSLLFASLPLLSDCRKTCFLLSKTNNFDKTKTTFIKQHQ